MENNQANRDFENLRTEILGCKACRLRVGCKQVVFGKGNPQAYILFVGEGPGAQEDEQGLPFVGASGKLLDKIIEDAGIPQRDVFIANVVKCRPPENRTPLLDEVKTCKPFLMKQIELIKPCVIITLGAAATQALIDPNAKITKVRGKWHEIDGVKYMPTFHPAALLRDPAKKHSVWEDIQKVRDYYRDKCSI